MFPAMHPIAAHQHPHPHPHPGFAHPMATQAVLHGRGLPRMPQPAHVHTHAHTAVLHNVQMAPQLSITQEELDTVLYGYAKNRNGDQCQGHALSGLNLNQQAAISEKSPGTCESVTFGKFLYMYVCVHMCTCKVSMWGGWVYVVHVYCHYMHVLL